MLWVILCTSFNVCSQFELRKIPNFGQNPGNLKMMIYDPGLSDTINQIPLVVVLHGCNQKPEKLAEQSGWNELAKKYGFIVVYPGQKWRNNASFCFNWFFEKNMTKNSGEIESIHQMIAHTIRNYKVDPSRVYIYGVSAGAATSVNFMVNYPELIQAGAVLGGTAFKMAEGAMTALTRMSNPIDLSPQEWADKVPKDSTTVFPKLMIMHGKRDLVVDFNNGIELRDQWTALHGIEAKPDSVQTNFRIEGLNRYSYVDTSNSEKIVFYEFESMGHTIAIDPGTANDQGGQKGMFAKDLDFFSTYFIAKDFGLIR